MLIVDARKGDVMGHMSAVRAADKFNKHAQLAPDIEPVTGVVMSANNAVHQHALKVPDIVAVIEQCERRFLLESPPL